MKRILFILIFFNNMTLFSQNIEIIGGLNNNSFINLKQDEGHFTSSYSSESGYAIRIGIENVKVDWLIMRFTIAYDKYGGKLVASGGGLGGGYTTDAEIDKSIISLGIFPINLKIVEKVDINIGIEGSVLISESFKGTYSAWEMGETDIGYDLNNLYDNYSSGRYFGLRARLAYDFNISKELVISPQYSYYLGLSGEFDEFPETTTSMRHYFSIGIQTKLK